MSSNLLKGWDIWLEVDGRFRKLTVAVTTWMKRKI